MWNYIGAFNDGEAYARREYCDRVAALEAKLNIELEKLVFELATHGDVLSKKREKMLARILDEYETV